MSNYANIIRENLHALCDNTVLTDEFLDQCVSEGILTRQLTEEINSRRTSVERKFEFYQIIVKKKPEVIQSLIAIMAEPKHKENFVNALKILGRFETSATPGEGTAAETTTTPIVRKQKKSVQFNSGEPENIPRWPSIASEEDLEEANLY